METTKETNRQEAIIPSLRKDPRATKILARSMFKEMTESGLTNEQILSVTSELIGMVTDQLKENQETRKGTA